MSHWRLTIKRLRHAIDHVKVIVRAKEIVHVKVIDHVKVIKLAATTFDLKPNVKPNCSA